MGVFRPDRERRDPDPWLEVKMGIFFLGALVGVVGMAMENRLVVLAAIVILAVGVLLRFVSPRRDEEEDPGGAP